MRIMEQLRPFSHYLTELHQKQFVNQPRLQARLAKCLHLLSIPKSSMHTHGFQEVDLYVLRVCELLILSCLRPQVEQLVL